MAEGVSSPAGFVLFGFIIKTGATAPCGLPANGKPLPFPLHSDCFPRWLVNSSLQCQTHLTAAVV